MLTQRSRALPRKTTGPSITRVVVARSAVNSIGHGEALCPGGTISGGRPGPMSVHASSKKDVNPATSSLMLLGIGARSFMDAMRLHPQPGRDFLPRPDLVDGLALPDERGLLAVNHDLRGQRAGVVVAGHH